VSPEARRAASREPRGRPIPTDLAKGATAIKLLVLDVDGIMTDGRMIYGVDGEHMAFHILDGHGIKTAIRSGLSLVIITGGESKAVAQRARELGILAVQQKAVDKPAVFQELLARSGLAASQVACVGDDLPDPSLLWWAGLAITVPDAVDEVRAAAHYATRRPGGRGAVREAIEVLLKSQGSWSIEMERYQR
jgi:3-deoxy-D-manno-octulosonate 8-phosphate phosphatase (KDO 8-P phosphatase)